MSGKDRRKYLTATVLDQALLDWSADNLDNKLEAIVDIETPTGTIHASDRNKYVDSTFYEALLNFPVIQRTVGEWLSPTLQFSQIQFEITNVDGRFNDVLPQGANYGSWVGKDVTVKIGLAEVGSTYTTVFRGKITEIGGVVRTVKSITILARDNYEALSANIPNTNFTTGVYPDLEDGVVGKYLPYIYGDFTVALEPNPAIVPAYAVNGKNATVIAGGANLRLRVSENDLTFFDNTKVYLKRNDVFWLAPSTEITGIVAGNNIFEVKQTSAAWVDGAQFVYASGDIFYVQVKGKDLGAYDDNLIEQARDILITFGGALIGQFDANWNTYRAKSSPAQSNIAGLKSRVWAIEPTPAIQYALSMLEQVRLEAFVSRDLLLKINSLQFEDFPTAPSFGVKNWDIVRDSFSPALDTRNNFNRAQGAYDYHPIADANARSTAVFKNTASITQVQRQISKLISFPNLYVASDVQYQLIEILRLASAMFEVISVTLTWRALLKDIGDFVKLDVAIGGTLFESVPVMIRDIGYDPKGLSIPVKGWSFALCPYPGYVPGYGGTVGGYSATIDEEV